MSINDWMDRLIAEFDGDVHGALKALLLINERLETELRDFYRLVNLSPNLETGGSTMH